MPQLAGGAALSTVGSALASSVIQIAVGAALFSLSQKIIGRPDAPSPEDVLQNIRSAVSPRLVHMGYAKVGGAMLMPPRSLDGKLYILLAQCQGEIDGRVSHFIDGREVTLDGTVVTSDPHVDPEPGNYQTSGLISNTLDLATQISAGTEYYIVQNESGDNVVPFVYIVTTDGTADQLAIPEIQAAFDDWTNEHRARGIALALVIADTPDPERFTSMYPQGMPEYSSVARWYKPLDPRNDLHVWSENPIAYLYDYLLRSDGMGLSKDELDVDSFIEAANDCDTLIASSAGSVERYKIGGTYSLNSSHQDIIQQLLIPCAGQIFNGSDGRIGVRVGKEVSPTVTLEAKHINSILRWDNGPSALNGYTTLKSAYMDQSLGFVRETIDPWVDAGLVSRYGREVVGPDAGFGQVPNHAQARRLAKIKTKIDNPIGGGVIRYTLHGLKAIGERVINIEVPLDDFGINYSGPAYINNVTVSGGALGQDDTMSYVDIDFSILESDVFTWSTTEEGSAPTLPFLDDDSGIPIPQNVKAYGYGGGIALAWDGGISASLTPKVLYRPVGGQWRQETVALGSNGVVILGSGDSALQAGQQYDVRVAFESALGSVGTYSLVENVTALNASPTPSLPTAFTAADAGPGEASISITAPNDPEVWKVEVLRAGTVILAQPVTPGEVVNFVDQPGAGSYLYTARSVNVALVRSNELATTPATTIVT